MITNIFLLICALNVSLIIVQRMKNYAAENMDLLQLKLRYCIEARQFSDETIFADNHNKVKIES